MGKIGRHAGLVLSLIAVLASCGITGRKAVTSSQFEYPSTADPEIVSSHVSGPLASSSRIIVRFVEELAAPAEVGGKVAQGVASISPGAGGEMVWADSRTIEFKPSQALPRGRKYTIEVSPRKINPERFPESSRFHFSFSIMAQSLSVNTEGFQSASDSDIFALVFSGTLRTADAADSGMSEKTLRASLDGKAVPVEWDHSTHVHRFTVKGIVKQARPQQLKLAIDGRSIEADFSKNMEFPVPERTVFKVLGAQPVESPEQCVEVSFSDPLLASQDFRGFVSVTPLQSLRFTVKDMVLRVYALSAWGENAQITIKAGIKNAAGELLSETVTYPVNFKPLIPAARFIGSGVIVPQKTGVTVPIETVNLSAVIVEIQKIYAGGIDQFLQVNELSGADELFRVGRSIWKKIVPVPYTRDRANQWIRTGLDLSPLVEDDSHSLYRITLSFDPRCVEYPGVSFTEADLMRFQIEDLPLTAASTELMALGEGFWEQYENRTEKDRDYDDWWENRDNPAHPAFYGNYYYDDNNRRSPSRNFLVSDLGMIAQRDVNNRLTVAVSNLLTAEPVGDAALTVFDFQLQKLAEAKTDNAGLASINLKDEGFLIVAESRSMKGYLKLQGASSLPVSTFDVTGQAVQKGVKGFLYGERGVWRPGDPIHLTFILQDKDNALPDDHPVVLRFFDPSGKLLKTVSNSSPVGSFYAFTMATGTDDPTGAYTARVSVGGVSFAKEVKVETVKANRLKIGIGFGAGVNEITTAPAEAALDVKWLHGAPAGSMRTTVDVQLSAGSTSFPDYKDYTFDDPVRVFKAESKEVFDGTLDAAGKTGFTMHLASTAAAPGRLTASFKTRVFEPGGNINTDTFSMPFHPYTQYAGIRVPDTEKGDGWLNVEEPHAVKIALVDTKGAPVVSGEVEVDVYEIGWRWWWDRHDDNIADYLGTKEYTLVSSTIVKVAKGAAEWTLKFDEQVWGRYLVRVRDVASRHATGRIIYMRWPGWYYSSSETGGDGANVLVFSADKGSYAVGETARITIPTAEKGKALVSIENNGRLIASEWIDTKPGQTIYSLKCTDKMTPNVYVHVSLVQPHGQTVNDRPIRMFGIIPLTVEDPATRLTPVIKTADVYEPNSQARVTVSEAAGKAMTYTLAIVDEGLLNLTRFTAPNPWNQFYKRDANGVATFDTYGMVAAAFGGTLEKLLAVGGGDDGTAGEGRKANRFPPMVRFLGPFTLAQGKKAEHVIDIPQYIGAVRVMVVAGSASAYGMAEKEVTVKKPVMIYATLPRVISVTETCALPVTIFAMDEAIKSVDVRVKTKGRISVSGANRATVDFAGAGEKQTAFTLAAGNGPGLAVVEVTATSGSAACTQEIEIDVRVPTPTVTAVDSVVLKKGESREQSVALPGISGTNTVVMEVSKIAPINLERRLRYLIEYPYGCVEQTTSAAFPQLYLSKITELTAAESAAVQKNVQAAVDRLQRFQTSSGGLGFWPGDSSATAYGTTYAAHFLLEAEKLGYVVPTGMRRGILSYLRSQVGLWSWGVDRSDLVQAYALYDLALAGEPELGAMNRMREKRGLDDGARFKLAAAYAFAGQKLEARRLTQGDIPPLTPYIELGGTYGSELRDTALLAEGYLDVGALEEAAPLINEVAKLLSDNVGYNTQATAYGLLAVGKYLSSWKTGQALKIDYTWDGKRLAVESMAPVKRLTLPLGEGTAPRKLTLTNSSAEPVYVRVLRTGQPAPGAEKPVSNGLKISVSYTDKDGKPLDVTSLPQGTDIVAQVTVANPTSRGYEELAMTYMAPAGWEISNPRFEGWSQDAEQGFEYQDVRDDRVCTFFSLNGGKRKSLKLMLNASYAGKYYLPPSKVEAMYDSSINAAAEGRWITVSDATASSKDN